MIVRGVAIALDFGGTKLAAGLVDLETGAVYKQVQERTPAEGGRQASLKLALQMVREGLLENVNVGGERAAPVPGASSPRLPVVGVGVSFGGHVDSARGIVQRSMHVSGWEQFPLADYLREALSLPAFIENDANAIALGLKHFGPGKEYHQFLYVTVSTGIGGALVIGDDVLRGGRNLAGEIGHMVIQPDGPLCSCGKRGCLEAVASGPAIARIAQRAWEEDLKARGAGRGKKVKFQRAEEVFQAARAGDMLAQRVIDEAAKHLGRGISYAVNVFDPDCVMIGGGVSRSGAEWFDTVVAEVRANVLPPVAEELQVIRIQEDIGAALKGAAALIRARALARR